MSTPYGQGPDPFLTGQPWAPPEVQAPAGDANPDPGRGYGLWPQDPGGGQPPSSSYGMVPQPPARRRRGLAIGLSIGAAIVIVAVGVLSATMARNAGNTLLGTSASPTPSYASHTLTVPVSVAGYTQLSGSVATQLVSEIRQGAEKSAATVSPAWGKAYNTAKISLYTRPGSAARLVFLGFSVTDTPQVAPILRSQSPSAGLDSFMLGAGVTNTHDYPAGPLGGTLRCGGKTVSGIRVIICAWADGSVLAMLSEAGVPEATLAHVTLEFRGAAEH